VRLAVGHQALAEGADLGLALGVGLQGSRQHCLILQELAAVAQPLQLHAQRQPVHHHIEEAAYAQPEQPQHPGREPEVEWHQSP
jgi:hypothetical protein